MYLSDMGLLTLRGADYTYRWGILLDASMICADTRPEFEQPYTTRGSGFLDALLVTIASSSK